MTKVRVALGERSYDVVIEAGLTRRKGDIKGARMKYREIAGQSCDRA